MRFFPGKMKRKRAMDYQADSDNEAWPTERAGQLRQGIAHPLSQKRPAGPAPVRSPHHETGTIGKHGKSKEEMYVELGGKCDGEE
jgi:hypothetical protein